VPPKVFGCTCFVHDYRNSVGKLDPRAIKCIFVGYSPTQKGYRCWSPIERRFFVSMDVTFREKEPYYISSNKITQEIDNEGEKVDEGPLCAGQVLIPLLDTTQTEPGVEEEKSASTDDENKDSRVMEESASSQPHQEVEVTEGNIEHTLSSSTHTDPMQYDFVGDTTGEGTENLVIDPKSSLVDYPIALRKPVRRANILARLKDCIDINMILQNMYHMEIAIHLSRDSSLLSTLHLYLKTGEMLYKIPSGRLQCWRK
jgi:hypothetical protein